MSAVSGESAVSPLHVVICDDDPSVPRQLEEALRGYFDERELPQPEYLSYASAGDMLSALCRTPDAPRPDIVFLDVEMPGTSGIQAGAEFSKRYPFVKIFIFTSHADYLDDAMRFHVFRYLSKPLDRARLCRNMDDALYQLSVDTRPVLIETAEGSVTRNAHEIILIETQGRRVMVRTLEGSFESVHGMKHWEQLLEIGSFCRTHRSFIVNMRYVRSFSPTLITMQTPDGTRYTAYLARRHSQEFKNAYLLYMEATR